MLLVCCFGRYNKTEDLLAGGTEMMRFSHVLIGVTNSSSSVELHPYRDTHSVMNVVKAFSRLQLTLWTWPPARIVTEPRIYLLKRRLTDVWTLGCLESIYLYLWMLVCSQVLSELYSEDQRCVIFLKVDLRVYFSKSSLESVNVTCWMWH